MCIYVYASRGSIVLLLYPGRFVMRAWVCEYIYNIIRSRESRIYKGEKKPYTRFLFLLRSARILSRAKIRRTFGAFPASGWHIPSEFHVHTYIYIYIPFSALIPSPRSPPSQFACMWWCFHPKKKKRTRAHNDTRRLRCINILIYLYVYTSARVRFSLLYTMTIYIYIYMTRPRAAYTVPLLW